MVVVQTAEQGLHTVIPPPLALLDLVLSTVEEAEVQVPMVPLAHTGEVRYMGLAVEAAVRLSVRRMAELEEIGERIPLEPRAMVALGWVLMAHPANLDVVAAVQVVAGRTLAEMVVCQAEAVEEWVTLPQVLAEETELEAK